MVTNLTQTQKKFIKKNLKKLSLKEIGVKLNTSENEILTFLKSRWSKEKFQKFLKQSKNQPVSFLPNIPKGENIKLMDFNFKIWFFKNWKKLVFLAFLVFVVYFNSLNNDFLSDDFSAIKDNPLIGQISYFWKPPYYDLSIRSVIIFLTNKLFGLNPLFFRLPNILFHFGSSWLILIIISFFFSPAVSLFTASVFAVHPILSESVTWISGGPYSGSAFFILLAFFLYLLSNSQRKNLFVFLSFLMFYFGLTYSEKVIVFPFILTLWEFLFGNLKNNWKKLIPFWGLSGFWLLRLFGLAGPRISSLQTKFYQEPGMENPLIQIPIAITSYFELIFWPDKLTFYHTELGFSYWAYFLRLSIFIVFMVMLWRLFKKNKGIFFWLSFFLVSLLPTLTPLRISWIVAERYVYLGSLGVIVLVAWAIERIDKIAKNDKLYFGLLALILLFLSYRTIVRNFDWQNQDTLWLATDKVSPSSHQNHNNLGDLYYRHGDYPKAVEEFKIAIKLKPNYGDAFHNLANTYHQMGEDEQALVNYQKAVSFNPNLYQSYQNLAAIYFENGKIDEARQEIEKALVVNPQNADLYANLGIIYLKLKQEQKAKETFQKALEIEPQNKKALEGLSKLP